MGEVFFFTTAGGGGRLNLGTRGLGGAGLEGLDGLGAGLSSSLTRTESSSSSSSSSSLPTNGWSPDPESESSDMMRPTVGCWVTWSSLLPSSNTPIDESSRTTRRESRMRKEKTTTKQQQIDVQTNKTKNKREISRLNY